MAAIFISCPKCKKMHVYDNFNQVTCSCGCTFDPHNR